MTIFYHSEIKAERLPFRMTTTQDGCAYDYMSGEIRRLKTGDLYTEYDRQGFLFVMKYSVDPYEVEVVGMVKRD